MRCVIFALSLCFVSLAQAQAIQKLSAEERLTRLERSTQRISELTLELDVLKRENRLLRGELELQQHTIDTLKNRQRDLYNEVEQRLADMQKRLQTQTAIATQPSTTDPNAPSVPNATPTTKIPEQTITPAQSPSAQPSASSNTLAQTTGDPEADYQAAYNLLRPDQRKYKESIAAFRAFLARYPDHYLASNAQYWLAEASYVDQDNKTALAEFRKVVENYPKSAKVPGALLKIGFILQAENQYEQATRTLADLSERFPQSSAAGMARKRLQNLAKENR